MKPLLIAIFLLLGSVTLAQQSDLSKPVQLKKGWMRIDAIMQTIYQQGGLKFSFNSQQINPAKKIRITSERLSVGAILGQVEQTPNVKFKVIGRHIILLNQQQTQEPKNIDASKSNRLNYISHRGSDERQSKTPRTNKSQALTVHKKRSLSIR